MEQQLERRREQARGRSRKYREAHPEKAREMCRRWRVANPTKTREAVRRHRLKNLEKLRAKCTADSHARRVRLNLSGGNFSAREWLDLKVQYGNKCLSCGLTEEQLVTMNRKLVPDHVLPLIKGGCNDITNIQPLCHGRNGCNNMKGTKHLDYRNDV